MIDGIDAMILLFLKLVNLTIEVHLQLTYYSTYKLMMNTNRTQLSLSCEYINLPPFVKIIENYCLTISLLLTNFKH